MGHLWIVYIGAVFEVITPATATYDSHYCTCLGHLGHCDRDRIISIYVALPKVAKASKVSHCHVSLSLALLHQLLPMETWLYSWCKQSMMSFRGRLARPKWHHLGTNFQNKHITWPKLLQRWVTNLSMNIVLASSLYLNIDICCDRMKLKSNFEVKSH